MNFSIEYDNQPKRFLKGQNKHIVKRIMDKIESVLEKEPVPHDAKSIVDKHNCFRIRIGRYRVLYRISHQDKRIVIFKIDKRGRAFD